MYKLIVKLWDLYPITWTNYVEYVPCVNLYVVRASVCNSLCFMLLVSSVSFFGCIYNVLIPSKSPISSHVDPMFNVQ